MQAYSASGSWPGNGNASRSQSLPWGIQSGEYDAAVASITQNMQKLSVDDRAVIPNVKLRDGQREAAGWIAGAPSTPGQLWVVISGEGTQVGKLAHHAALRFESLTVRNKKLLPTPTQPVSKLPRRPVPQYDLMALRALTPEAEQQLKRIGQIMEHLWLAGCDKHTARWIPGEFYLKCHQEDPPRLTRVYEHFPIRLSNFEEKVSIQLSSDLETLKRLVTHVFTALKYLQEAKVVHRSLSPSVIACRKDGEGGYFWVLTDFECAVTEKDLPALEEKNWASPDSAALMYPVERLGSSETKKFYNTELSVAAKSILQTVTGIPSEVFTKAGKEQIICKSFLSVAPNVDKRILSILLNTASVHSYIRPTSASDLLTRLGAIDKSDDD